MCMAVHLCAIPRHFYMPVHVELLQCSEPARQDILNPATAEKTFFSVYYRQFRQHNVLARLRQQTKDLFKLLLIHRHTLTHAQQTHAHTRARAGTTCERTQWCARTCLFTFYRAAFLSHSTKHTRKRGKTVRGKNTEHNITSLAIFIGILYQYATLYAYVVRLAIALYMRAVCVRAHTIH